MRRPPTLALLATAAGLGLAGCGGGSGDPDVTATTGPEVFAQAGCASCHTLAAAGAHGHVGPDLDKLRPGLQTVIHQVEHGGGGMPAFGGQLSAEQIHAVARYVVRSTR